jgi:hypothetical protein
MQTAVTATQNNLSGRIVSRMASLSFPPLSRHDKWGAAHPKINLSVPQKDRSVQLRALSEATVLDLRETCGHRFKLLAETIGSVESLAGPSAKSTRRADAPTDCPDGVRGVYGQVWGVTAVKPDFNPFEFARKRGFAPRPKELPAHDISSLSAWFAEYGRPKMESRPGVRTEFEPSAKSVPRGQGQPSAQARMIRGTVLR